MMADTLMKYETIDRFQIDDIMEGRTPRPPQSWNETPPAGGQARPADEVSKQPDDMGEAAEQH
jgi:cell division protease FtsH